MGDIGKLKALSLHDNNLDRISFDFVSSTIEIAFDIFNEESNLPETARLLFMGTSQITLSKIVNLKEAEVYDFNIELKVKYFANFICLNGLGQRSFHLSFYFEDYQLKK